MKKVLIIVLLVSFTLSCSQKFYEKMYKKSYTLNEIVAINEKIINAENIAEKKVYSQTLNNSIVEIEKAVVKNIVESQNVDYDFCVVADVENEKGKIQINIFSKNIKVISQLKSGESVIKVIGEFGRMYKLFDDYYLKIDIQDAAIAENKAK
ncbi:MAG: hypothetical protein JW982_17120 [Spirochaetes bacterium]|nr:hypothetical protein [Spirochaetota bacterium]